MRLCGHVAEPPVMGAHAAAHRQLEGHVGVVARMIRRMNEGRTLGTSTAVRPMALGTVPIERRLARFRLARELGQDDLAPATIAVP
jgi:hypothetical protein